MGSKLASTISGPVSDRSAVRVCTLAGIDLTNDKVTELEKLKKSIENSLGELEKQKRKDETAAKMLLVLKLVKATCDGFIGLAADLTSAMPGLKNGTKAVKNIYGVAKVGAEAGGEVAAGGSVDWLKTGTAAAKAGSAFMPDGGAKVLVATTAVKTDVIRSALKSDEKGVKKNAVNYGYELTQSALKNVPKDDPLSGKAAGLSTVVSVIKTSFDYNQSLQDAFDEYLALKDEARDRQTNAKVTFMQLSRRIQKQIDEFKAAIGECQKQLANGAQPPIDMSMP